MTAITTVLAGWFSRMKERLGLSSLSRLLLEERGPLLEIPNYSSASPMMKYSTATWTWARPYRRPG